jgi:RNA polymerase sigma-70 factor (ECF subfamily)
MADSVRTSKIPDSFRLEEELMGELYRQMLRVARHKLFWKNDAVDVVQEAWVRILEHYDSLRESEKLIPWAKAITANLASNANRNRKAELFGDRFEQMASSSSALSNPELVSELSDLLGRMDPTTRTLFLYKFYYGFKDDEIAAALDLPVGTVKARIHRSKARLKSLHRDNQADT